MYNEEEAVKEIDSLSLNTKRFLADKLGNKVVNIKLSNELSVDSPRRKEISQEVSEFFRLVNRYNIFSSPE